jgi:hypothetical protein
MNSSSAGQIAARTGAYQGSVDQRLEVLGIAMATTGKEWLGEIVN